MFYCPLVLPSFKERGGLTNGESSLTVVEEEEELHQLEQESSLCQRRNKLPSPVPDMADFSLWSILRKNIGTRTTFTNIII